MDISFTNVLEGARQYFQGLPAASSSTGSPSAQIASRENDGSVHSEQHSAVPYWDHQNEGQGTNLPNRDVMNPSQGNNSNRTAQNHPNPPPPANYHYDKGQTYSNYPATSQISHVYQSHIPSSSTYYEIPAQQPKASYSSASQSQPVHHQTNTSTTYNYQPQTNLSHNSHSYPNYGQSTASSSSQAQDLHYKYNMYNQQATRSQPSYQTSYYQTPTSIHQQQRATHHLPVVPTDIYHSRTNAKPIQHQTTTVNTSNYQNKPMQNTPGNSNQNEQRISIQNGVSYPDQYKYYQNTAKYTASSYNTATTTTTYSGQYGNNNQNYIDSRVNMQQRQPSQHQPQPHTQPRQQHPPQPQPQPPPPHPQPSKFIQRPEIKQSVTNSQQNLASIPKHKRESPLDLSVKTVKTSADSTLSDFEDRNYRAMRYDMMMQQYQSARAPKVDFLPNFNMPNNSKEEPKKPNKNYYNYTLPTSNTIPVREPLPRIDFPSINKNVTADLQRKRSLEHIPSSIPEKMPKVDTWRQTIDKQIEQRLSSYTKSRLEQEQKPTPNTKPVNGNMHSQLPQTKLNMYGEIPQRYSSNNDVNTYKIHSNISGAYHYPQYPSNQYMQNNQPYQNQMKPKVPQPTNNRPPTTATKKVLSLLRNSLQIKGAKEALKKMEQQEQMLRQNYREIQQPSTDVMAPLQPKPGIVGRRNVSPFTAASLERNSNTPPAYKLHLPKAIDSVIFSDSEKEQQDQQASMGNRATPTTDLDGLAAFLYARIRTKAELKQVGPSEQTSNNNTFINQLTTTPPKLKKEPSGITTPKKLFTRNENGEQTARLNKRSEIGGIRSSSETSVFDFPDSDNEGEMPVLERQSLVEMRKDRKTVPTQFTGKLEDQENERPLSPFDMLFNQTCDTFMEQLKSGCGKKRGRRKKPNKEESNDSGLFNFIKEEIKQEPESEITQPVEIKLEESVTVKVEVEDVEEEKEIQIAPLLPEVNQIEKEKTDSDSDTPLIICKNKIKNKVIKEESKSHIDASNEVSSDSELESISKNIRNRKKKEQILLDLKASTPINIKTGKKPVFGDGSHFHPGWEEELYRYKKSLRMPRMLIQVTRPPNCKRLSTSLPDLDPCPVSPAQSSIADCDERRKFSKADSIDSDMDSNCSFNFSLSKMNYDSEEGSCSVKSLNTKNNSILDKLLERYGGRKRKRLKKSEDTPKMIPKPENPVELLPTPSLELRKQNIVVKSGSAMLGFRKKTVDTFKDAFINNTNSLVGVNEFTTVVLKSRTRTETRVLKEKATIREVFGEDRPASAPPVTCLDELKPDDDDDKKDKETVSSKSSDKISKLLNRDLNDALFKVLGSKKIKEEEDAVEVKKEKEDDTKTDVSSIDGEILTKKRSKLRNIRRKFSSGFDYIRKKKKSKKEDAESEIKLKPKKRPVATKATPESVQDIQKEIKMWVLNKGVGETHLHRASRSGYTDVTAYCLEKMACNPSPKDNAGYTPLHEACSRGHLDIARLLLQYGAHVSESAQGGIRPLHEAAENGFVEIVRLLLSYGADATLATYSGITPLQLAVDETTIALLQQHLDEIQGKSKEPWQFTGPASCFDLPELGYDPLIDIPEADSLPEEDDIELEVSEQLLPNLYTLPGSDTDRWVLLQDLSNILKIKSKETLLRQLNVMPSNSSKSDIVKELKMVDFLEQAHCCQFLNANEKLNTRSSKIFLVKYTDKVKRLLNVEKVIINVR